MQHQLKLFYVLLGCTPPGRHTEQYDVFFCIGESLTSIKPHIRLFWPDAGAIHIDAWREVNYINGYAIAICSRTDHTDKQGNLFFINLGGYLPASFEEHHHKILTIAKDMAEAISMAKQTDFYLQYNNTINKKAVSHVDNKYGVDIDEILNVEDMLLRYQKEKYAIRIIKKQECLDDILHIGYLKWDDI